MRMFAWNVFLATTWAFAIGRVTLWNLFIGFLLGYMILGFVTYVGGTANYYRTVRHAVGLLTYFVWQLFLSNLRVAHDIITPRLYMKPGIIAVPLDAKTPLQITLLANFISMTPGSLSLEVSGDCKTLFVHTMFIDDVDKERRKIKDGFERRVMRVFS